MNNDPTITGARHLLDALLTDFLDEAGQLLDRLNEDLLVLDAWVGQLDEGSDARCDEALLNQMFRSAHSIKGLSAMLALSNINRLTHCIENVFDAARKAELELNRHIVQTIFEGVDKLAAMVAQLRAVGHDEHDASDVIEAIRIILQSAGCERAAASQADAEVALAREFAAAAERAIDLLPQLDVLMPAAASSRDHFAGVVDEGEVPAKYLAIFIDETEASLDALSETLLSIDELGSATALENLLITAHRIKGSAASIGLHRPAKLAHLMEDLLQELRESHGDIPPELAEAMLQCTDALRAYVGELRTGQPAGDFNHLAVELLVAHASCEHPSNKAPKFQAPPSDAVDLPAVLRGYMQRYAGRGPFVVGYVRFLPGLALAGMKAQLIYEKLYRVGELLECAPAAPGVDELEAIDLLTFALATEMPPDAIRGKVFIAGVSEAHVVRATPVAAERAHPTEYAAKSRPSAAVTDAGRPNETLRVDVERLDQLMNLAGQLVINKARFVQIGDGLKEAMFGKQTPQLVANAANRARKLLQEANLIGGGSKLTPELEAVRSHARRLSADLEAVQRELARVAQLRNRVNDLFEAVHQLDRVTDGIQKSVMDTRMVPIGPLFGRFKRVVRDITRLNGKEIELAIHGEKTELDKRMIDELGDPLIHMVRNAADHGIESPAIRVAAGKPAQGTLTLDAFHRGNHIIIQVRDDGQGLDKERILAKAIEKKLISPTEAEKMSPQQAYQLIWEPGFSTAEKVTEISGRGMGMDIVRSKIEEINGTVEVDSRRGQGTIFTIKLPLTLAILPSLMAEIEGDVFALPIEAIVEIVSVPRDALATIHGMPTAAIRGRVVSVVELNELLTWSRPAKSHGVRENDDCTLVVLGQDGAEIGLRVDALLGEEDVVIKSMAENYRNVAGIAGASILGDGRVSLILDVAALIEIASHEATVVT